MRVAFETIVGKKFEGDLYEIDNGTAIITLDDGTKKACPVECLWVVE